MYAIYVDFFISKNEEAERKPIQKTVMNYLFTYNELIRIIYASNKDLCHTYRNLIDRLIPLPIV